MTKNEICLCGLAAVRARFERDAASVQKLFFDLDTGRKIGPLCKGLAAARKIYRCVEPAELEKISGTLHHEMCIRDSPKASHGTGLISTLLLVSIGEN